MKQSESSSELLDSILRSAEEEARDIIKTAEDRSAEILQGARDKAAVILNDAESKASESRKELVKNSSSTLSLLKNRQELKNSRNLYNEIMDRVARKLKSLTGAPEYRELLLAFTAEAALGLVDDPERGDASRTAEFILNGGPGEMKIMDSGFIKDAESLLADKFGLKVTLKTSTAPPLPEQGVELTGSGGRRAFRNSFKSRTLRYEQKIRDIIDAGLQKQDEQEETP
ncbi:MAG: V-type ATP synthase subunit E family protein [Spirochaetales bacterium]|nr:V-type ATP synthase subunit E family protein [Spirochaetales bacterium]